MKEPFKFESKHYGMKCNVPYIFSLTIIGYVPERKLVRVQCSNGQYNKEEYFVPEEDIVLEDNKK